MVEVKDKVVEWFIRNILLPRNELIDNPGFIINKVTKEGGEVYLRDVFMPEQLFVKIEDRVTEQYGDEGAEALYSVGK